MAILIIPFHRIIFVLSIAASAGEVVTLYDIDTMQEMTSSICSDTPEGYTKRLKDVRDGKLYWVAKMKDNNCWMTQNLDLDLYGRNLTPETSDVTTTWTGGSTVESGIWNTTDDAIVRYYDPGNYVYTKPGTLTDGCIDFGSQSCNDAGWINTDGLIASNSPSFGESITDGKYNAHYEVGNYYNYTAATAGQFAREPKRDSYDNSICPKGWTLPMGGKDTGQFIGLFEAYGWTWTIESTGVKRGDLTATLDGTTYDLTKSPFYMLAASMLDADTAQIDRIGKGGYLWLDRSFECNSTSSVSKCASGAMTFISTPGHHYLIPSSSTNGSYQGYSVRCVAR